MKNSIYTSDRAILIAVILFLLIALTGIYNSFYYYLMVPAGLLTMYWAFFHPKMLMWTVVLATPFSMNLEDLEVKMIGGYLPTEPFLVSILLLGLINYLIQPSIEKKYFNHPITKWVLFYLLIIGVTTVTSAQPIVSLKFFISKIWYIIPIFFLMGRYLWKKKEINKFYWLFISSLSAVVIYTIIHHSINEFTEKAAHWVMSPFFKDHTSYGAVLALMFPLTIHFVIANKNKVRWVRIISITVMIIIFLGTVFSYTRAAWVSLVGVLGLWVIIKFKIKKRFIALGALMALSVGFLNWYQIQEKLESNKKESSDSLTEHVESISNISSDASNLERINRWKCAYRMFRERPLTGFGPGTYAFEYAPYQRGDEKTIISTNFGDAGNAHSEYLGPLAEMGLFGMIAVIGLFMSIFFTGVRLYYRFDQVEMKSLVMAITLGFATYMIHGTLNNYLDTDKASVPIWIFAAILVGLEVNFSKLNLENSASK